MGKFLPFLKKESKPTLSAIIDDYKNGKNPDYFKPHGVQVLVGRQGSGKSLSAVKLTNDLKQRYPKAILVSNLLLTGKNPRIFNTRHDLGYVLQTIDTKKDYVYFQTMDELHIVLTTVNNDIYGVIYLIDEIHTYLNALNSKNTPMHIFTEIAQQRKQRKLIIATSQLFMRLEKALREQCDNVIVCNTIANYITVQKAYDGMTIEQDYSGKLTGQLNKVGWFIHSRKLRNSYDTFQKVVSSSEQYEQIQRPIELKQSKKIRIR